MSLIQEVRQWFGRTLPCTDFDEGYYFVRVKAPFERLLIGGACQSIVDELLDGKCWLITVGTDPRLLVSHLRAESETVVYNSDYNVHENLTRWTLEVASAQIDISRIADQFHRPSHLSITNPADALVLDVGLHRIYGADEATFNSLLERHSASFQS
jgi:hypothetical protein